MGSRLVAAGLAICALVAAGCGEKVDPNDSVADQLKSAKIDPKGTSKEGGLSKASDKPEGEKQTGDKPEAGSLGK